MSNHPVHDENQPLDEAQQTQAVSQQSQQPEQKPNQPKKLPKKHRRLRWLMLILLALLVTLSGVVGWMTSTEEGSKRLLAFLTSRQQLISYTYLGGDLQRGVILGDIKVTVNAVDVHVKKAMLKVGWRALVKRELHFRYASLDDLRVIKKTPPSDEPFDFKELKLPFTLRFDQGFVHGLTIQARPGSAFTFDEIVLHDALWSGTRLSLRNSSLALPYLKAQEVTGNIEFQGKYPIHVDGQVLVPALDNLKLNPIFVAARGDVDTLRAGVAISTPDLIRGQFILHPVRKDVPFKGYLNWKDLHWPVAEQQNLFSKSGNTFIDGTTSGLIARLQTDLSGDSIPAGEYQAELATNYHSLNIRALNGRLMNGTIQTQGTVQWQNHVSWDISGRASGLNSQDQAIPEAVRSYLPPVISGNLYSKGELDQLPHLYGALRMDSGEIWLAGIARQDSLGNTRQPLWVDARWQNINRALPAIGYLNSPDGRALINMPQNRLNATVSVAVGESKQGMIPAGRYEAQINKHNNLVVIPKVNYQGVAGNLQGSGTVSLPQGKQGLKWQADLQTKGFDPSKLAAGVPFNRLSGTIHANGQGSDNQQIIKLNNTHLTGFMPASNGQAGRTVELSGNTTAALFFYPENARQSGLKSFAVQFNGDLKTPDVPEGDLIVKISGTPQLININEFRHNGAAGKIDVNGQVDLSQGPAWRLTGLLDHFNPGFFARGYDGWVSGRFNTTGHWQTNRKDIQLSNLNLDGIVKNQPLIGRGSLNISLGSGSGFIPERFEAQNLLLSFAGNQISANGNSDRLALDVNAPALNRIYAGMTGNITGRITLTGDEQAPDALINLKINRFAFNQITVQQASLVGRIPQMGKQPGQLQLDIQNLKRGIRTLTQGRVVLAGTKAAHVLQISALGINPATNFSVQLAGGLDANNDWLGQVQKGRLGTQQLTLLQDKPAALIYRTKTKAVYLDQHCWLDSGSRLCLIEPLQASSDKGLVSVQLKNLDIGSFQAFMPQGVAWVGKLFGHAKVTWVNRGAPTLDAQIYTDNGEIGLAPEDPQDEPITLPYQRLSLIAVTQPDGIKLRFDAKTPGIGTGFIDATINPSVTPKTVNGALVLDNVQMNIFKPFFPGMRVLNGTASLAGGISGPLTGPDFYGEFRLRDGQVAMNNLPINLNRINLSSSIRGTEATLNGSFLSGDGQAQIQGDANWQGVPYVNLSLTGERLLIRQAPMVTARVTPKIDVRILPTQQQVSVNGTLDVPSAVISMPEGNDDVIAKSGDVRIVRLDQVNDRVMKAAKPWAIFADIDLTLGNDVYFRGFGNSIPLGGRLNLTQRGLDTAMRGNGAIGVRKNVTIEAYGQRLQLNRGIARFNGIITQPDLDIDATKTVSGRIIGVRITGRATNPNIAIYNDAGLSEQEALNALLTGKISSNTTSATTTAGFKSDVNNTIAAAGISMGLGGTRRFTNTIGRTFGLESLTLDAEGVGDDTQVSLTGYITSDLYLRYGVGVFTPVNRLTLRYQLNRRLYIEASSALDRAVDMFYNWRF
ncbi:translocation/assembly module TamB domain-containing protein [Alkanindiges sp. WGS2144]|uniref:translocation/assembly module TamB domain-containing protein n=1 Tax=Alkanindiges sp. WGS2144 TaxID=3366808 RepID=UPI0037529440